VAGPRQVEHAVRTVIRGRVRGVGVREATRAHALELGLRGWVRHGEAGEEALVHAEGEPEAVEALLGFLRDGPREAEVVEIEVSTVEPEGHEQFAIRGVSAGRFHLLRAERSFELRLEVDGGVRAWALPKGPSMDPATKRMAFEAGDGGGVGVADSVEVWDEGDYEQGGRVPWPEAIERGHAVFVLHGDRLAGGFALQRIRTGPRPQWLLIKRKDDHARPGSDVVGEWRG
jgi:DNA ligase D-like protein (predicted 3'-phosphoesterase)